jgi:hypothetical protein
MASKFILTNKISIILSHEQEITHFKGLAFLQGTLFLFSQGRSNFGVTSPPAKALPMANELTSQEMTALGLISYIKSLWAKIYC